MELPDTINAKNDIDQNGRALFLPFFDAQYGLFNSIVLKEENDISLV